MLTLANLDNEKIINMDWITLRRQFIMNATFFRVYRIGFYDTQLRSQDLPKAYSKQGCWHHSCSIAYKVYYMVYNHVVLSNRKIQLRVWWLSHVCVYVCVCVCVCVCACLRDICTMFKLHPYVIQSVETFKINYRLGQVKPFQMSTSPTMNQLPVHTLAILFCQNSTF
jgi:hypothetical protein